MDSQTFLSDLRDSNLLPPDKMEQVMRQCVSAAASASISQSLVENGLLTAYQVKLLAQGQGKGLTLGQYQILDELGRGGFGCVYKARHTLMDRLVALKVIAPERMEDRRARDWFLREVRATTRLNHPNIVLAYDAAEVDGQLFLAMEYIEGPTLHRLVQHQGPLPLGVAWQMLQQSAQALRYAHEQHLVHRDIKPANLLIPATAFAVGRADTEVRPVLVKVVDFGLARLQSQGAGTSMGAGREGTFIGTPDYVAPEQARNTGEVDIRSDLYSLGCTFYLALTGRKPFPGNGAMEVILQHIEKQAVPIEHLRPEVPAPLAGIVRRLMEKKPENRFQTPDALLAELNFLCPTGHVGTGRVSGMREHRLTSPAALAISPIYLDALSEAPPPSLSPQSTPLSSGALDDADDLPATRCVELDSLDGPPQEPGWSQVSDEPPEALPPAPPPRPELERRSSDTLRAEDTRDDVPLPPPPAPPAPPPANEGELQRRWARWYAVLDRVQRGERAGLGAEEYRALHLALLGALRNHADGASGERRALYQRLAGVVEPWLSLENLVSTEAPTLRSLQARCQQYSRPLGLQCGCGGWLWAVLLALLLFLVPVVITLYQARGLPQLPRHLSMRDVWQFLEAYPILSLAGILPCVVLVGFSIVSRLARK